MWKFETENSGFHLATFLVKKIIYVFNHILLTYVFATDLRWSNSTILSKNYICV